MATIYKYYPSNCYSLDAVMNKYFWFSKNIALNDPFDMAGDFFLRFPEFGKAIGKDRFWIHKYEEYVKGMAICCFSKESLNKHLWALYASSYSGFVLGFDDEKFTSLHKDNREHISYRRCYYEKEIPNFDDGAIKIPCINENNEDVEVLLSTLIEDEISLNKVFEYYLLIKDKEVWEIEQEKRLILNLDYISKNPAKDKKGYQIPWPQNSVKTITWGSRICPEFKKKIESVLPSHVTKTTISCHPSERAFILIGSDIRDND